MLQLLPYYCRTCSLFIWPDQYLSEARAYFRQKCVLWHCNSSHWSWHFTAISHYTYNANSVSMPSKELWYWKRCWFSSSCYCLRKIEHFSDRNYPDTLPLHVSTKTIPVSHILWLSFVTWFTVAAHKTLGQWSTFHSLIAREWPEKSVRRTCWVSSLRYFICFENYARMKLMM